jgi:beta-N-acetylhexosaminidase
MRSSFSAVEREALGLLSPGFGGTIVPDWIKPFLENGLGGITLFGSNTPTLEDTARVVQQLRTYNPDLIISIDEEGGDVTRIYAKTGNPTPSAALLGMIDEPDFTQESFRNLGITLRELGIDLTFAPVADVVVALNNPIVGVRSFGPDTELVCRHVQAAVEGVKSVGLSCSLKHFPGHGGAVEDSHHGLPRVSLPFQEFSTLHLAPFLKGIAAGADSIMVGHIIVECLDANLACSQSPKVMKTLLRNELSFQGAIITDALDMGALGGPTKLASSADNAIKNGADLLCLSGLPEQEKFIEDTLKVISESILAGEISDTDVSKSLARIKDLKADSQLSVHPSTTNIDAIIRGFSIVGNVKLKNGPIKYLRIDSTPTIAAGNVQWGIAKPLTKAGVQIIEAEDGDIPDLVLFRDAWREPDTFHKLLKISEMNSECIFIDMGWPSREFSPTNLIRTYGVSEIASRALVLLLLN